jgi:hypothetical protein
LPARLVRVLERRSIAAVVVAGALVVSAGVGGATAGALITGRDIAAKTITSANIADNAIGTKQLSSQGIARLQTRWNAGSGAPRSTGAAVGTWYLDETSGDTYKMTARGWEFRVNIMGATGAPGAVGPQGVNGPAGATGVRGTTGEAGERGAPGAKGDRGDQGERGETGADGADGAAGSVWLRGSGAPSSASGAIGDWYLDTTTYDTYQKTPDGWTVVVNLRGPIGPKGEDGATGATGETGQTGAQGSAGPVGAEGPKGQPGITGADGATGSPGPSGPQGVAGPAGPPGPAGPAGAQGPAGPAGADGSTALLDYGLFYSERGDREYYPGNAVAFPYTRTTTAGVYAPGLPDWFVLRNAGTYRVTYSIPVSELGGQFVVSINQVELPYTMTGLPPSSVPGTGGGTITGQTLVEVEDNAVLQIKNPTASDRVVVGDGQSGGAGFTRATLLIERIR